MYSYVNGAGFVVHLVCWPSVAALTAVTSKDLLNCLRALCQPELGSVSSGDRVARSGGSAGGRSGRRSGRGWSRQRWFRRRQRRDAGRFVAYQPGGVRLAERTT